VHSGSKSPADIILEKLPEIKELIDPFVNTPLGKINAQWKERTRQCHTYDETSGHFPLLPLFAYPDSG
jgi:hypothetical protein